MTGARGTSKPLAPASYHGNQGTATDKKWRVMKIEAIPYLRDTIKSMFGGREINYISSTPQYDDQKREKVHAEIEHGLYAVFAKYVLSA